MSAKATFWAWEQEGISSSSKLVLLCLADCHNADTDRCDPSAKYVSEKTGLNIKTIPSSLKNLEEIGLISTQYRAGKSPRFALNITQKRVTPISGVPKNGLPRKRIEPTPKTGEGGTPKSGDEPKRESKKNLKKNIYKKIDLSNLPESVSRDTAEEFIDHRINLKKPLTQEAFDRAMKSAVDCIPIGINPEKAIQETIDAGWQGIKPAWLKNRLGENHGHSHQQPNQPGRPSAVDRVRLANEERERQRQAGAGDGSAMGVLDGDIRPQVGESVRGHDTAELGAVIDGYFTRPDQ